MRRCAQYLAKQARRVWCDRRCERYYYGEHGALDANSLGSHKPNQQSGNTQDTGTQMT